MSPLLDHAALAELLRRPALRQLLEVLNWDGEETRIVGGAVRNVLLGREVQDVDLATTALPDLVSRRAAEAGLKVVPTGVEHGTVTVVVHGEPFEVTTLREDVKTDGRRAVVRFGRDFAADARRRDFTINALSAAWDGRIHDYVGGLADLATGKVRFIGDPDLRIREDYLRILRFFRLHGDYATGPLDAAGLDAAIREGAGLAILSRERIRIELLKLLVSRRAAEVVVAFSDTGLLSLILSGVAEHGRLARVIAFEETSGEPPVAVRRLGALLVATVEDADRLRERLRLSNQEHERLVQYAALMEVLKTRPLAIDCVAVRSLVAEHGLGALLDVIAAVGGEPRPQLRPGAMEALRRFRDGVEPVPTFPLRGADLVARGASPGPRLGEMLALARRAWLASGCPDDRESVERLLRNTLESAASPGA